jgi:hypothetical protein
MIAEAGTVGNLLSATTAMDFLTGVLAGIMYMSIPIIGLVLVYSGFMFISARGNSGKLETATRNITYVVVAIALLLGSYMIARVAYNTIVVDILGWTSNAI